MATPTPISFKWVFLTLLGFTAVGLLAVITPRVTGATASYDAQRAAERYQTLAKLRADEQKTLTHAAWVDEDKQIVRIPLEEALPKALDALKAKLLGAGDPLPGAALAPAANPASAPATNAAPTPPAKAP